VLSFSLRLARSKAAGSCGRRRELVAPFWWRGRQPAGGNLAGGKMATPVVPSQFAVGKNKIVHKPTTTTFSFDPGQTTFKSVDWGRAGEQSGPDFRKDDIMRVAQRLLSKLPR
jgi:hypothetical protein